MKKTITFLLVLLVAVTAVAATIDELKESAILGDREAMYKLSVAYMERKDYERSDYWLERAAKEGQADAKEVIELMGGKTDLSAAKRSQLATEEKRERERLLAERKNKGNTGGGTTTTGNQTFTVNGVSFTMVQVQGGTFIMGATSEQGSDAESREKPAHNVTMSSYHIGETEVTQELWKAVMGKNPSVHEGGNLPVENVSWKDCQKFIKRLNKITGKDFRLPTEAEWEFAARGGNLSKGYKYSGSDNLDDVAWYFFNSCSIPEGSSPREVATKQSNELGLYDMSGNVFEWCSDWYGSYSRASQTNPTGPSSGSNRVSRGGGWGYDGKRCRVSDRDDRSPDYRNDDLGLRLAL